MSDYIYEKLSDYKFRWLCVLKHKWKYVDSIHGEDSADFTEKCERCNKRRHFRWWRYL